MSAIEEADCLVFLVPPNKPGSHEHTIMDKIKTVKKNIILGINKIDLVPKDSLLFIIDLYRNLLDFTHIVPLSALHHDNVDRLISCIISVLPAGAPMYPDDMITDRDEWFRIAELIREQVFLQTQQEIPYSVGVLIDSVKENAAKHMVTIFATILVEKDSHKGIIIGKQGSKLKIIGQQARLEIEHLLSSRVFLDLRIKHVPNWKKNPQMLTKMGIL